MEWCSQVRKTLEIRIKLFSSFLSAYIVYYSLLHNGLFQQWDMNSQIRFCRLVLEGKFSFLPQEDVVLPSPWPGKSPCALPQMIRPSGGQSGISLQTTSFPEEGFIKHFQCRDYPELKSKLVLVVQDSPEKSEAKRDAAALTPKALSSTYQAQVKAKPRLGDKAKETTEAKGTKSAAINFDAGTLLFVAHGPPRNLISAMMM